jgi:hypothetical protein
MGVRAGPSGGEGQDWPQENPRVSLTPYQPPSPLYIPPKAPHPFGVTLKGLGGSLLSALSNMVTKIIDFCDHI